MPGDELRAIGSSTNSVSANFLFLPRGATMAFGISVPFERYRHSDEARSTFQIPFGRRRRSRTSYRYRASRFARHEPSALLLAAKRGIDFAGSGAGLLLFLPLLLLIAAAIKLTSPGPVFFRQKRYGYHNRRFWIYKFRTMYADLGDSRGTRQTTADDPRITPLGRILRKSSLDELPQLINVFKGDMSLVGPRPHVPGMLAGGMLYEELTPYYFQRHNMRPGITGLAQVSGYRGSTAIPLSAIERLDRDLRYIETWSLALDVSIIVRTAVREFTSGSGD
jgi:lipopolysaccharide/colanic/teichoic acid biosynthesis glycosyltransferase